MNKLSWWRFPNIGTLDGDGGKFFVLEGLCRSHLVTKQIKRRATRVGNIKELDTRLSISGLTKVYIEKLQ